MIEAINDIDSIRCMVEDIHEEITNTPDYWTRLEHTYAGMAMQGMLNNSTLLSIVLKGLSHEELVKEIANAASNYAHALVQKVKEERK